MRRVVGGESSHTDFDLCAVAPVASVVAGRGVGAVLKQLDDDEAFFEETKNA